MNKKLIHDIQDKMDIPSLKFFKKYEKVHGILGENIPPYYYAKEILEIDKREKIYVGNLAYKLFVKEKNRIGEMVNKKSQIAFQKNFNQMKKIFEQVIKGYTKKSYEEENEFNWKASGDQKKLMSRALLLGMPNLEEYIKSYQDNMKKQEELRKRLANEIYEEKKKIAEEKLKDENEIYENELTN
ncbi:MAG: hypothetical protein ACQERZ_05735 [Fusobacteriota bacterium]